MRFKIRLKEEGSPEIEIERSFFGKIRVYAHEREAERLKEKGKPFLIRMNDGSEKRMFVETSLYDYVPKVVLNGEEIPLARALFCYEYLFSGIPLILVFAGGMIGAFFGIIGSFLNLRVMRMAYSSLIKVILVLTITTLSFLCYSIVVIIVQTFIGR